MVAVINNLIINGSVHVSSKHSEYANENLCAKAPDGSNLRVGDVVTWTNDHGIEWVHVIIGFLGGLAYLNTSSYWSPHELSSLLKYNDGDELKVEQAKLRKRLRL